MFIAAALALVTAGVTGGRQELPASRSFEATTFTSPIQLDARLDEEAWSRAVRVDVPYETSPGRNAPARAATVCRLGVDARHLYFACEADDPDPTAIRAYYTDRDQIATQDRVGIALDTFADTRKAFVFAVSPLGVQSDAIFDQERLQETPEWDAIWASAGRITPTGYVVEAAIPLRSLRFPADGAARWRFYVWRARPRSEEMQYRSTPDDPASNCALCTASVLGGLSGLRAGGSVDITPTLTAGRTDRRQAVPSRLIAGDANVEPGIDLRWALASDLSLNVTVNPDYSQVEADVAALDANTRFALSYPEKRPFFLEGTDLFETPVASVFTRTIANPAFGAKLTGRAGRTSVGAIVARDHDTNVLLPRIDGSRIVSIGRANTTTVGRVRHDLGHTFSLGALYTGRVGDGYANHVGGVDASMRPIPALTLSAQVQRSASRGAGTEHGDAQGGAFRGRAHYVTREWNIEAHYDRFDRTFRADAGFVGQVGYTERAVTARRTFWIPARAWITSTTLSAAHWPLDDPDGRLFERWQYLAVDYRGPWQSRVAYYARRRSERYLGVMHQFYTPYYGFSLRPTGAFVFNLNVYGGSAVAYSHGIVAGNLDVRPDVEFRIGRHLSGGLRYARQRLTSRGDCLLDAALTQGKVVYTFNPRTFVRAVLQHRDTTQQSLVSATSSASSLLTQYLFSYKLNPETVLFVGYSDTFADLEDPPAQATVLARTSRTIFLKVGYAFRP